MVPLAVLGLPRDRIRNAVPGGILVCYGLWPGQYAFSGLAAPEKGLEMASAVHALLLAVFDVVTLHHVVEHLPEPRAFLRQLRPRVRRRLLIELPNFASLASRVHGPQWRDLRPDQHVYHYVPATLRRVAEAAGFTVVRTYTLWESLWSLRTALDVLRLLPGLIRSPRHQAFPRRGTSEGLGPDRGRPAAVCDVSDYRPPTGAKSAATTLSRIALAPIVAALEAAGLGERLVLEAEPNRTEPEQTTRLER